MRFIIPVLVFTFFLFAIDVYTFQGIELLTRTLSNNYQSLIHCSYWATQIGLIVALVLFVTRFIITGKMGYSIAFFLFGTIILFYVPKLVFLVFQIIEDLSFLAYSSLGSTNSAGSESITRFEILTKTGALVSIIPFITILYGMVKGKFNFTVFREEISFPDLPKAFDGFRIVQLSDLHIGSFRNNYEKVSKGFRMVNSLNPDLIVFTGDMVNHKATELEGWEDHLSRLKAPYGKYSILGNHDYGDYINWDSATTKIGNLRSLKEKQASMGFKLLLNETASIEKDGETIQIIGVENWGSGGFGKYGKLKKAIENVTEDFKILLSHDPSHWEIEVKNKTKIQLTLSGHTHGMQFGIESFGIKWSPIKYRYPKWAGLYKEKEQYLYVNRGFGYLGFPGRVGIKPEITLITLRST